MECRAGAVGGGVSPGQCMMIQLLLRVQKPLSHYSDCQSWCSEHYVFTSRRVF